MNYKPLHDSVGFLLGSTYRRVTYAVNLAFRPFDLTAEQWILLMCLMERDGITQTDLAQMSGKDKTTVTRLLGILGRKEMVFKRTHETDKRALLIFLTPKGRDVATQLIDVEQAVMKQIVTGMTEADIEQVKSSLRQIHHHAENSHAPTLEQ